MRSLNLVLPILLVAGCRSQSSQQWPNYGIGETPTAEEISALDISISPTGKELPPGNGNADQGANVYAEKCASCHGPNGSGGMAPLLIKTSTPSPAPTPASCLAPCIQNANVMAIHSPYATTLWDYVNRGMPYLQEGTLKPDEVYAVTAFLLYSNGVIREDEVMNKKTLPQVKMPNRDGFALAGWKPGKLRPSAANR